MRLRIPTPDACGTPRSPCLPTRGESTPAESTRRAAAPTPPPPRRRRRRPPPPPRRSLLRRPLRLHPPLRKQPLRPKMTTTDSSRREDSISKIVSTRVGQKVILPFRLLCGFLSKQCASREKYLMNFSTQAGAHGSDHAGHRVIMHENGRGSIGCEAIRCEEARRQGGKARLGQIRRPNPINQCLMLVEILR